MLESERPKDSPTSRRWQAQIDNSFDALLGFASSELDRTREQRRRSSENERPCRGPGVAAPDCAGRGNKEARSAAGSVDPRDPNYMRSDSRSDSRDSGLGKDSEVDSLERSHGAASGTPLSTPPADGGRTGASAPPVNERTSPRIPRHTPTPGSPGTSKSPGLNSSTDSLERSSSDGANHKQESYSSPSRPRSRSRSPLSKGPTDKNNGDKYSNYDRHFKKKFFKLKAQSSVKSPPSSPLEVKYGKFRPKGKDWERNQKDENKSGNDGKASDSGQAEDCVDTSPVRSAKDKHTSPVRAGKDKQQAIRQQVEGGDSQGSSHSVSTDSRHSAFMSVAHGRTTTPTENSRPHSSSPYGTPKCTTPQSLPGQASTSSSGQSVGPSYSGTPSTPSGRSSVPSAGPVRPTAELPHSSFAELAAQATMGQVPFSGVAHQALTEALARGHAPPPHLISAGLIPARVDLPHFDFDGSRMAMLAELAAHRGPAFSFGGPPTFRPPFGADFGPRQPHLNDFAMTRPGFNEGQRGFDGQIFSPLTRQSFNSNTAASKP